MKMAFDALLLQRPFAKAAEKCTQSAMASIGSFYLEIRSGSAAVRHLLLNAELQFILKKIHHNSIRDRQCAAVSLLNL